VSPTKDLQPDEMYHASHLAPNSVNYTALTPLTFLKRNAVAYRDKIAVIHGPTRFTYSQLYHRCQQFANALRRRGVGAGDTVAVIAPNVPPLLEAHYGVPMAGAVLNALNCHLDAHSIAFILAHGEAKLLIADREFAPIVSAALKEIDREIPLVEIQDGVGGSSLGGVEYEAFLAGGDPAAWEMPHDEWDPIALNYTSGTTGNPKGVVYHHRGAFLSAMANAITFGLDRDSVYLWTLPMYHCNGWGFTWAVTAVAGTHVCLRRVDPASIFMAITENQVTHMCGAPIVLNLLMHAPQQIKRRFDHLVNIATGGAAPPSAVIEGMERMGFRVTHLYGLTESYGPSTVCAWQDGWADLPFAERAVLIARQGVANLMIQSQRVVDPATMTDVPADSKTLGELVLRGNTLMRGYFKNPTATDAAFDGGWFHTGDLAVQHPDGYIEIKDRSKDIIIVGGDNLSSLEVEEVLYRHPQIMEAAVVAKPEPVLGEIPCAFVTLRPEAGAVSPEEIIGWCRARLAHYKVPRAIVYGPLPKTSTGKIQKFQLRERAKTIHFPAYEPILADLDVGDGLERELQKICEKILGVSPIEFSDSIFELGVDSLRILTLFLEIGERTKCDLPIGDLFATPTIKAMASLIRGLSTDRETKKPRNPSYPDIRPVGLADVEPLCRFLSQNFVGSNVPPAGWGRLFDYKWLDQKPDLGLVLTVENEIVGFLGAVYASRQIGAKTGITCNHTSWYVDPKYRGWGAELLAAAVHNNDITFTALTPEPGPRQMLEAVGFSRLDRRKLALPPLLHLHTLRNGAPVISFDPEIVRRLLNHEHQEIFDHHAPYDCLQLSVEAGSEGAFLIVKRRVGGNRRLNRLFPTNAKIAYSEVLYCSSPGVLADHLERIKLAIFRQQHTLLLVCDERMFQEPPKAFSFDAPMLYRSPLFKANELDKLYSEMVLLPV
jgi:fatty-acyl-CoA synthase